MLDSSISQSRRVEMERELEPWIPDEDDPRCPELENIFDGHWNRLLYSNFLSPNLLVIVQLFNSFSTWFRCHLETIFSIGDLTFVLYPIEVVFSFSNQIPYYCRISDQVIILVWLCYQGGLSHSVIF